MESQNERKEKSMIFYEKKFPAAGRKSTAKTSHCGGSVRERVREKFNLNVKSFHATMNFDESSREKTCFSLKLRLL
jgi:hypothetical protein